LRLVISSKTAAPQTFSKAIPRAGPSSDLHFTHFVEMDLILVEWNHCDFPSLKVVCTIDWRNPPAGLPSRRSLMPWYAWLILVVAIGSIVGGLMMLRDTATKVDLTEEQRKRVAERNAEMDAKEAQDR